MDVTIYHYYCFFSLKLLYALQGQILMDVSRLVVVVPDISAPGLRYVTSIQDSLSDNYAP
jgi:hypothetical protein